MPRPAPNYPLPLIHMNGTGFQTLSEDYDNASKSLEAFIKSWVEINFNARDYYVISSDAYTLARQKRDEMNSHIRALKDYILEHLIRIQEQERKTRRIDTTHSLLTTMSRIPIYSTPNKFAQDLHDLGLFYDIQESPSEQQLIHTDEKMFTEEECLQLDAIVCGMDDKDHEEYHTQALLIIHDEYRLSQSKKHQCPNDFNPAQWWTPDKAALVAIKQPDPLEAAIAIIRHNMEMSEYGWACEFIEEYQINIEQPKS